MAMEYHEIADIFPLMQGSEFDALVADIKKNGLLEPIWLYEGKILDGRNRYRACQIAGVEPRFMKYVGDSPLQFVVSCNLHRRHLTESQRAVIAAKMANTPKHLHKSDTPIGVSQPEAAKMFNVSERTIQRVKAIEREAPELIPEIEAGNVTAHKALKKVELKKIKKLKKQETTQAVKDNKPVIYLESYTDFLNRFKDNSIDLLITDPPYSTDVGDIAKFVDLWLSLALEKLKPSSRAYICIGAYPEELNAYLTFLLLQNKFIVDNPLIWTYENTLGQTPKMKYNLNYQVILHLYSKTSRSLNTSVTREMFCVQKINAPDGRQGDRFFKWQKPDELARRLIYQSAKEGDIVVDCFAGTGTFLLAAAQQNCRAFGCETDHEVFKIALERGCQDGKVDKRFNME